MLSVLTFRTPDEAVEKANNTPYGLSAGIWTEKGSRILAMVTKMKAGVVWANTFNRFDPTSPFGGYKESGFGREGGMHGLHAYVGSRTAEGELERRPSGRPRRIDVRKTYKLYIGGAFPRSERVRASYVVRAADGAPLANAVPGLAQGPPRRGPGRARRVPGWADKTAMNRGQVLYRVAELMEGRRDQFVAEVAAAEGLRDRRRARGRRRRAIDRWVWYAGWADKIAQVLGLVEPGRGAVLQLHDPRADRRRRRRRARDVVAAGARLAARPAARRRQRRGRARLRERGRCPRSRSPRCSPRPTSRAASSTS